jgi:hypothetical protein
MVPVEVLKIKPLGSEGVIEKEVGVPPETVAWLGDMMVPAG